MVKRKAERIHFFEEFSVVVFKKIYYNHGNASIAVREDKKHSEKQKKEGPIAKRKKTSGKKKKNRRKKIQRKVGPSWPAIESQSYHRYFFLSTLCVSMRHFSVLYSVSLLVTLFKFLYSSLSFYTFTFSCTFLLPSLHRE